MLMAAPCTVRLALVVSLPFSMPNMELITNSIGIQLLMLMAIVLATMRAVMAMTPPW